MNKTIVTFSPGQTEVTFPLPLYQYDYGQQLVVRGLDLPDYFTVHFANVGDAESVSAVGTAEGIPIPDAVLADGRSVRAYFFLHDSASDGETEYVIALFVIPRPPLPDDEPTPSQQSAVDQAIDALNKETGKAEAAAALAGEKAVDAAGAASLAESWARGGTGARAGEEYDNAKFWAMVAQQGAKTTGYVTFDVHDEDGHMYVTVTDDLSEDVSFIVNEQTGRLEVTYHE